MTAERQEVRFDRDGDELVGALHLPGGGGPSPGVVLVPAIHGVSDYLEGVAGRLAAEGYATLIVDIFSRGDRPTDFSGPDKIKAAVAALPDERVTADVVAAGRHLASLPEVEGQPGVLGFCVGGLYAYLAGCDSDVFAAAVNFYGMIRYAETTENKPVSPIDRAEELQAPMLAHYGTNDPWCPLDAVDDFEGRLEKAGKTFEVYRYPGAGHAFHENHRAAVYRPAAASDAWSRSLAFLDYYLKGLHA